MTVPFTILTGYLGAGKTTALNRFLSAAKGKKIAVLVNELGKISIDSQLIENQNGDVLELAGGCLCCKIDVKNDLWDGVLDVVRRSAPEHVILETTGIAEPNIISIDLEEKPALQQALKPYGVITVVDAFAGTTQLKKRPEAEVQLACADRIMLSKLDIVSPQGLLAIQTYLQGRYPDLEIAHFPPDAQADARFVSWMLAPSYRKRQLQKKHPSHEQLVCVTFQTDRVMVLELLEMAITKWGQDLVRLKGYCRFAGNDSLSFIDVSAGRLTKKTSKTSEQETATLQTTHKVTELVLMVTNKTEDDILATLWSSCAPVESSPVTQ